MLLKRLQKCMNKAKTYYIFRHGLATHSTKGYGAYIVTQGILPKSIPSIKKLANHLKSVENPASFSSDIIRCRQTAEIVSNSTGFQFTFDKRLDELMYDESFEDFKKRIESFLEDVQRLPNKNILICTHGAVIAGLTDMLTDKEFTPDHVTIHPLPGVLRIIKDRKTEDVNFN